MGKRRTTTGWSSGDALSLLACALLLAGAPPLQPVQAQFGVTTNLTGLIHNATSLRVAVIVNCVNDELYPDRTPPISIIADITQCDLGLGLYFDWFRMYRTFERVLREKGGIPSSTGYKTPVEFVYFNIGGINYVSGNNTLLAEQYKNAAQNTVVLAQLLGAFGGYDMTTNTWDQIGPGAIGPVLGMSPGGCRHCPIPYGSAGASLPIPQAATALSMTPGAFGRFSVFVPPTMGDVVPSASGSSIPFTLTETWFAACQLSKACIVVGQYEGKEEWMRCKPQIQSEPTFANPAATAFKVPNECTKAYDPTLLADKRETQRRFDYGFTALPSQSALLSQLISWFKIKAAKSAVLFYTSSPGYTALPPALAGLKANAIELLMPVVFLNGSRPWTDEEARSWAARVVGANPDLVLMLADAQDTSKDPVSALKLFRAFRDLDWTPKAFALPGGSNLFVTAALNADRAGDGGYVYGATFNSWLLNSPFYDARDDLETVTPNWEPFPSRPDGSAYSPEVCRQEYIKDWGETEPLRTADGYIQPQIAASLLVIITKLFYAAGTDDARFIAAASSSISVPSIAGLLQFDSYGRLAQNEQYVTQHAKNGYQFLITPLNVGRQDVYPMPTWKERVAPTDGSASFLGTRDEKIAVAMTTVVEVYLLVLLLGIFMHRSAAIIKSASPSLCAVAIVGGMICVASNYGVSLFATSAGCAADAWLLTTGFTMMFSALFAKTWRVYKIFQSDRLKSVKLSNATLYLVVAALVGVAVIVNSVWTATAGFPVRYVQVDAERPLYDYVECSYADPGQSFVWFHLAFTGALILGGIVLTVLARNLPSMFNETPYLAASMYNCAVLLAFVLPIVASDVGGRNGTLLIRDFGLLLIVASTASILFVPKFMRLARCRKPKARPRAGATRDPTHSPPSPRHNPARMHHPDASSHPTQEAAPSPMSALEMQEGSPSDGADVKQVAFGAYKRRPVAHPQSGDLDSEAAAVDAVTDAHNARVLLAQSQAENAELRRQISWMRKAAPSLGGGDSASSGSSGDLRLVHRTPPSSTDPLSLSFPFLSFLSSPRCTCLSPLLFDCFSSIILRFSSRLSLSLSLSLPLLSLAPCLARRCCFASLSNSRLPGPLSTVLHLVCLSIVPLPPAFSSR